MLRKKLFTIICAIAILEIGACFLPPEHVPSPPLPPYLAQISTFAVQVHDISGKDFVDGDTMSQMVSSNFNQLWKDYSVRARPFRPSGYDNPTLRITIVRKSVSSSAGRMGKQRWDFELITSSTLIGADGRLMWQNKNQSSHSMVELQNGLPADGWNSRVIMKQVSYSLAMSIGQKVLNLAP